MEKRLIKITDCDHPSVNIEKEILSNMGFEVILEQCQTEDEIIEKCKDAEGLIVQFAPITRKVLSSLPNCKVIAGYGVGFDNVDIEAATEFGIQICNVPDYSTEEVSDHALALIFNMVRKVNYLSNSVKNNEWDFRLARPISRMGNLTIGVVGLGSIGVALAKKATQLDWNVIAYVRNEKKYNLGIKLVSFEELIKQSDVISIHLPLTKDSYHLFNKEVFKKMKKNAVLINTARGSIVNERDLVDAINSKEISGAGLDVLEQEPPEKNNPLFKFDNVTITPHSAYYSEDSLVELKQKAAEETGNFLTTGKIRYPVNSINTVLAD